MFQNLKFRQKLTLILIGGFLSVISLAGGALVLYQNLTAESRAREYLKPYAELVSVSAMAAVDFEDSSRAQQILEPLNANAEIFGASILLEDGRVLATYKKPNSPPFLDHVSYKAEGIYFDDIAVEFVQYLKRENASVAQLHIWVSRAHLQSLARQAFWISGLCLLLLFSVILVLSMIIHRMIILPISELARIANLIRTEADFVRRAPVVGGDEIAILSQSFNSMMDSLQYRDESLRKLSSLQRVIVDRVPYAIISCDAKGVITSFNPAAEKLLGYSAAEMIGWQKLLVFHDSEEVAQRAELFSLALGEPISPGFETLIAHARRNIPNELEWIAIGKNGLRIPVLLSCSAIHSRDDEITGYLGVMIDVTERNRSEAEIRKREHRFRTLIENGSDLITVIAADSTITFQSPSVERILGYQPEELIGCLALDIINADHKEKVRLGIAEAIAHPGVPYTFEIQMRHKNGSWRLIETVGRCGVLESERVELILNSRDISQSTKLEEQLRQSQKLEAIGQLSGGVAHDFNNILTVIQGNISLLEDSAVLSGELNEAVGEIKQSAERAANLTRQLLAFSRRQTIQLRPLDLNDTLLQMIRMLRRILGEDIQMQIGYSSKQATIKADSGMMEQVLLNLVVNARDAMPSGGRLTIETDVLNVSEEQAAQMLQARPGLFICMTVTDTGSGISKELLPKIFEPFFTTKEVGKGTGLGLATVYGIIQQHQGWITVASELGRGTTFKVFLPYCEFGLGAGRQGLTAPAVITGSETILFVEDEPSLHKLGLRILQRLGYTVLNACNGIEALEIWEHDKHRIQLLVTDLVMPGGLNGRELAGRLLASNPRLPVVFTSGYSADIVGNNHTLSEEDNFLGKPYTPESLGLIVRSSLNRAKQGKAGG